MRVIAISTGISLRRHKRGHLEESTEHSRFAGREVAGESLTVPFTERWRNQDFRQALAHDIRFVVTEDTLRGGVELGDASLVIHGHDRVKRRVEKNDRPLCA